MAPERDAEARAHERAGLVWRFRAGAETDAARRFARLASDLEATSANATVIDMAREAARDEERHVELCRALAARFGNEPGVVPAMAMAPRANAVTHARVLCEAVAISCITETLSAAVLAELRERAIDLHVRQTVAEILRDEVQHSRLGWAHLAAESARGPVAFVADTLVDVLSVTVEAELFRPSDPEEAEVDALLAGYGALSRNDRQALFDATLREVIFPGLERFGVDTALARRWLEDRLGPAAPAI